MIDASKIAKHPALAEFLINELQARVEALSAYIRAALNPETENQYEAI